MRAAEASPGPRHWRAAAPGAGESTSSGSGRLSTIASSARRSRPTSSPCRGQGAGQPGDALGDLPHRRQQRGAGSARTSRDGTSCASSAAAGAAPRPAGPGCRSRSAASRQRAERQAQQAEQPSAGVQRPAQHQRQQNHRRHAADQPGGAEHARAAIGHPGAAQVPGRRAPGAGWISRGSPEGSTANMRQAALRQPVRRQPDRPIGAEHAPPPTGGVAAPLPHRCGWPAPRRHRRCRPGAAACRRRPPGSGCRRPRRTSGSGPGNQASASAGSCPSAGVLRPERGAEKRGRLGSAAISAAAAASRPLAAQAEHHRIQPLRPGLARPAPRAPAAAVADAAACSSMSGGGSAERGQLRAHRRRQAAAESHHPAPAGRTAGRPPWRRRWPSASACSPGSTPSTQTPLPPCAASLVKAIIGARRRRGPGRRRRRFPSGSAGRPAPGRLRR